MGLRILDAPNTGGITEPVWKNWFRDLRNRVCRKIKLRQTPLTGFSITVPNEVDLIILTPAGALASGSFVFPSAPEDDQILTIVSTQNITAITVTTSNGQAIFGVPGGLTANTPRAWLWDKQTSTWYRTV